MVFSKHMLILSMFVMCMSGSGSAEPVCEPTKKNVPRVINGKNYVCDECVKLSCDDKGKEIKGCKRETSRSCVEAPVTPDKPAADKGASKKPAEKKK